MAEERRIGPYRIFEPLGRGGMGVVYRARHVTSERAVALKTVQAAAHFTLDGLRREITALTTIRHPGVVRIVDHGIHEGLPWYAMDLLEGESLRRFSQRLWSRFGQAPSGAGPVAITETELLSGAMLTQQSEAEVATSFPGGSERSGPLPPAAADDLERVLGLMRRLCLTLAFLHGEGFINCDFKPENVLIVNGLPVLIDFGLTAHQPSGTGRELLDVQYAMSGTAQYMSPEQIRGEIVDARSDLYAVGCVLFELVTGRPPFGGSPPALIAQHLSTPPPSPSSLARDVPEALETVILKLLEKDPARRFGYADEVAAVLAEVAKVSPRVSDYPPGRAYLYRSGFVGRDQIVADLVALRDRAARGTGACVLIGGESGIGKTRLAMELARGAPSPRMRVVTSEVPAPSMTSVATSATPLHSIRSLLVAVADACQEGGPEATDRLLGERRAVLALYEPLLAQVPASEPLRPVPLLAPDAARPRLFRYLWETIAALTREQPVLWVIDDLGWADQLSLDFLATQTPDFLAELCLFIVGTYRSEEPSEAIATLAALPHVTSVKLPRLDSDGVRSMVCDMLALQEPPEDFLDFVSLQTEGNPFFVSECLRGAVTDRILFREANTWRVPSGPGASERDFASLPLPRTLRDLIERRLKSLSPAAAQVALAAAVLGREMDVSTLERVVSTPDATFVRAWDDLLRRQVLEEPQPGRVRFAHDKLRESVYANASAERLRDLHARAGEALESLTDGRADALLSWAALGHHFSAANNPEKAARYLRLAADYAQQTYANTEAITLYREAIEQVQEILLGLSTDSAPWFFTLLELYESLGDVLGLTATREAARTAYDDALRATLPDDVVRQARLHRKVGKSWEAQHVHTNALAAYALAETVLPAAAPDTAEARDEWIQLRIDQLWVYYWLNRAREMADVRASLEPLIRENATASQRARFFHARSLQNFRRDRYSVPAETLALAELAMAACQEGPPLPEFPMVRFLYGFVLLFHGSTAQAEHELGAAFDQARRVGDTAQQARCLTYVTVAARQRGSASDVERLAKDCAQLSLQSNMREYLAAAWGNQAWVSLQRGDAERARTLAENSWAIWRELTAVFPFRWLALLPLLALELDAGRIEGAIKCAEAMLAPDQHALPSSGANALADGVRAAKSRNLTECETAFRAALKRLDAVDYR